MPEAERNEQPQARAYGAATAEQEFVANTAPAQPVAQPQPLPTIQQQTFTPLPAEAAPAPDEVLVPGAELTADEFAAMLQPTPTGQVTDADASDLADWLPVFTEIAQRPDASPGMRAVVERLQRIYADRGEA